MESREGKIKSLASNLRSMANKIEEKSSDPKFEHIADRLRERAKFVEANKKESCDGK